MKYSNIKCVEITNDRTNTTVATEAVTVQKCLGNVTIGLRNYNIDTTAPKGLMFLHITPEQAREVARALNHYAGEAEAVERGV